MVWAGIVALDVAALRVVSSLLATSPLAVAVGAGAGVLSRGMGARGRCPAGDVETRMGDSPESGSSAIATSAASPYAVVSAALRRSPASAVSLASTSFVELDLSCRHAVITAIVESRSERLRAQRMSRVGLEMRAAGCDSRAVRVSCVLSGFG